MVNFLQALVVVHSAGTFERYVVAVLITYVTDVWGLGITEAASLIYIWIGTTKVMPLIFLFLMDNYIGSYSMLILSTTASALGMGLLSVSTPSWLYSRITGSCNQYKVECISETQHSLFYFALILIMVGKSAREATVETINFKGNANEQEWKKHLVTSFSSFVVVQASLVLLAPWSIIFGISSVCSWIAVFLLMDKSWSHKLYINEPEKSPVTTVLRVFVASILKISKDHPYESPGFNQQLEIDDSPLLRSSSLRLLEKAAIRLPIDKGTRNRWTLCSLQEVEDAKTFVKMLPVGVMFIFLVLISSISRTYFIEQAKRMKPLVIFGVQLVDVSYLIRVYLCTKDQYHEEVRRNLKDNKKYEIRSGVVNAVIYATLCCLIAALVEKSRLNVIRTHGLQNKPGEIIPMTMFWLFPQFFLLGHFDASLVQIILIFFEEGMSLPMKTFKIFVVEAFIGVGMMFSVLVVYVVGRVSQMGGGLSWFQHDTENSRLDLFYWALTLLCVVVFTIWLLVSSYFDKKRYPNSQQQLPVSNTNIEMYTSERKWD